MFVPSRRFRSGAKTCRESHWVPVGRVASCCAVVCLLMSVTSAQADDVAYGYDALGRLTSVTVAGATAYYDYDAAGNITAIRRQGVLLVSGKTFERCWFFTCIGRRQIAIVSDNRDSGQCAVGARCTRSLESFFRPLCNPSMPLRRVVRYCAHLCCLSSC